MTLPRLHADLADARAVARVLRGALRHEVEVVPLTWPPTSAGQHLLEIDIPSSSSVVLLADPVGGATDAGQPLHVRPVTREQMATLLHLVESLDDESSKTVPPPPDDRMPAASPLTEDDDDATLVDPMIGLEPHPGTEPPPAFGMLDSVAPRTTSTLPEHALVGAVVGGKYRIESVIGSGASAAVFRATHLELKRAVAVKILHEQNRGSAQFVRRFKAEAFAASKLEHPNVARVLDFGLEPDGMLYIAMEHLAGRSLEAILAAEGRLTSRAVVKIAVQVCAALAHAHDAGIIHRDVKPENIMLVPGKDDDGHPCDIVKVCDFGLAKLNESHPDHEDLTTSGMLCGSPAYMSPEQTRGEPLDARSDIYSLGVTLFEALTGTLPHDAGTLAELFVKKAIDTPPRVSELVDNIDPALDAIVQGALAADRAMRPANARAFRDDLRRVLVQ